MNNFGVALVCVVVLALGDVFALVFNVKSVEGPDGKPTLPQCFPYGYLFLVKRLWCEANRSCPVCKSVKHTVLGGKVMVGVPMEVLVCMFGFPVYCYEQIVIRSKGN